MKALGAEIIEFYQNNWVGDDWYYEDTGCEIQIEDVFGRIAILPSEKYDLRKFGVVCWQGAGIPPNGYEDFTFERAFKQWKKSLEAKVKTIKYKFIPLEERSNEDLSRLYASIHMGYYRVDTESHREKILKLLNDEIVQIKQFEIEIEVCKKLNKTKLIAAQIDCGDMGILRTHFDGLRWRHYWIDKEDFDYRVEVLQ